MIDIQKVALQIKEDSLYNTILFEVEEKLDCQNVTTDEIVKLLNRDAYFLQEYRNINRYSELSSIHAKQLSILNDDSQEAKTMKERINNNVQKLKDLENFSVDSTGSAYEIWIGSVGVMSIFMLHNIIALFTELYATHSGLIYTFFAVILGGTYYGYKKIKHNHEEQHCAYQELYSKTNSMIDTAFEKLLIKREELY